MKKRTILYTASALALAGGYYVTKHVVPQALPASNSPPVLLPDGSATQTGLLSTSKTVAWVSILNTALTQRSRFLALTVTQTVIRDQAIDKSWLGLPSQARLRVKYQAEYPVGFAFEDVSVSGGARGLTITLNRPQLVAAPAVRLLSAQVLDSGFFIDEQKRLVVLQQQIQPEAERRAASILQRPDILPRSEAALRGFLEPLLARQADGPPPIVFVYR